MPIGLGIREMFLTSAVKSVIRIRKLLNDERIPKRLRRGIGSALARLECLPKGRVPNPFSMLGYQVFFLGEDQFRILFDELFLDLDYLFSTRIIAPVIIDCGSNIGLSVIFFKALYPGSKITAFEPDPETFETLSKNIERNSLKNVVAHQCALTAYDGAIDFYKPAVVGKHSLAMSINPERMRGTRISVPATRLAPFLSDPVDLLKIDIEGAEENVLADLYKAGVLPNVKRIHLEYHHHIRPDENSLATVLKIFEDSDFGYQIQAGQPRWPTKEAFQDVSVYAYNKKSPE